jgi:cation:H+ antiporter
MNTWLQLALGLILLLASGEFLVRGAVGVARALGVSPLFIGLTLVGFGTSTPELVASLLAAFRDAPGIAVGNVVGSNIANILLILGVTLMISAVPVQRQAFHRDAVALSVASVVGLLVVLIGRLDRLGGFVMVATLVAYIALTYRAEKRTHDAEARLHEGEAELHTPKAAGVWKPLLIAAAALGGVILGARLLVDSAIVLARDAGISETVVGLTVVAVGTSLPELVVSVIAAFRGQGALAVGNIVGSNIYNILFILGATALARPIPVPPEIARADIWIMLLVTAALLVYMVRGRTMGRGIGAVFLVGYSTYVWTLVR